MKALLILSLFVCGVFICKAKIYDACEFATELINVHGFDKATIGDWICLVQHESNFDTAAVGPPNGDQSRDHGIFQINDKYWCAPPRPNNECGVTCDALRTDDITEAVKCAKKIFSVHGFEAWYAWISHCKDQDVSQYVKDCSL